MAEREIQAELDALREDLSVLRRDLGELLKAVTSSGKEHAVGMAHKVQEEARHRMEQVKDAFGSARDTGQKLCKQAHRTLGNRPVTSMLAAFAVGMVIGRLINGRR
ncbi:MAG: hypothetical protein FWE88_08860 [Phycisphaerae bacterium]|nr:hypothetical protein [Phycisphaerae bacterium]